MFIKSEDHTAVNGNIISIGCYDIDTFGSNDKKAKRIEKRYNRQIDRGGIEISEEETMSILKSISDDIDRDLTKLGKGIVVHISRT